MTELNQGPINITVDPRVRAIVRRKRNDRYGEIVYKT